MRADGQTTLMSPVLGFAKNVFKSKVFNTKIRFTVDIPSSQALHLSISDYKPKSKVAIDYKNLTNEILEDIE